MTDCYSEEDFFTIDKIDAHIHYYSESDAFLNFAKQHNIRLLSINVDFLEDEWITLEKQTQIAQSMLQKKAPYFAYLGAVPMSPIINEAHIPYAMSAINKQIKAGAIGVKIWKNIGMKITYNDSFVMIDNPLFEPLLNHLSNNNIPLLGHFGEPRNCWLPLDEMTVASDQKYYSGHPEFHMFKHPEMPSYNDQVQACDNMLVKNPNLNFIGAHLGSSEYSIEEMAKRLDRFPKLKFDMAERICHLQHQSITKHKEVHDFAIKYQDRLLYGSDMVFKDSRNHQEQISEVKTRWINQWRFLTQSNEQTTWEVKGVFKGLSLPKSVIDKIYYTNAIKAYPRLSKNF